jgi:AbrB family looped-hinge helix DNA binding protein
MPTPPPHETVPGLAADAAATRHPDLDPALRTYRNHPARALPRLGRRWGPNPAALGRMPRPAAGHHNERAARMAAQGKRAAEPPRGAPATTIRAARDKGGKPVNATFTQGRAGNARIARSYYGDMARAGRRRPRLTTLAMRRKGIVTIPEAVRKELDLHEGDHLVATVEDGRLVLIPGPSHPPTTRHGSGRRSGRPRRRRLTRRSPTEVARS